MTRSRKERLASEWFKEDRLKYKGAEYEKEKAETEKAIRNSTVIVQRLRRILDDKMQDASKERYDVETHNYALRTAKAAGYEKAIAEIQSLLDFT